MYSLIATVLFVFGPSCGGKSTFSKALVAQLGPSWSYLDRDQLIEEGLCVDKEADAVIEGIIQGSQRHWVVDAQIPWRAPQQGDECYILVHAPLTELLARDALRTIRLQRPPKRTYYARLYVEETHALAFQVPIDLGFAYDLTLDSSQHSVDSEVQEALRLFFPYLQQQGADTCTSQH